MHCLFMEKRQIVEFNKVIGIFPEGKNHIASEERAQSQVSSITSSTYSYNTNRSKISSVNSEQYMG